MGGPNLLIEDFVQDEIERAANEVGERNAGFISDPEIRDQIEEYAMECAKKYLVRRKYRNITRTDKARCYDYTCTNDGRTIYVEVKGTQNPGDKIILTKNEKSHLESTAHTVLYVRHSINVVTGTPSKVSGGIDRVLDRWDPKSGAFSPIAYLYTLPILD